MFRKIPLDTVSAALVARIKAELPSFAMAPVFVDLDEFWNLETNLANLQLPCVIVEFVQCEFQINNRDSLILQMTYRINYLCRIPSSGNKRSEILLGTRQLAEVFSTFSLEDSWASGLNLAEQGIDRAVVELRTIQINNDLAERNVAWSSVTIDVSLISSPI